MNLTQWLIDEKYAKCEAHARNIIVGLHLDELYNVGMYEAIKKLVALYRDWRNATKWTPAVCYEKALIGEAVPIKPMFDDVTHSEKAESE